MKRKTVGILGGMGPDSTVYLFDKIVRLTPAKKDQGHLRIIIDNNPQIPDRTLAILGKGKSSLKELVKTAKNLEGAGADFIIIPCNTAHFYYDNLKQSVNIPVVNMISELSKYIKRKHPEIKKVGLLATSGTIKSKIYTRFIESVDIMVPDKHMQKMIMNVIYGKRGIKAGYIRKEHKKTISSIINYLVRKGAQGIILGCTEIALLNDNSIKTNVPVINPLDVLACVSLNRAQNAKKIYV